MDRMLYMLYMSDHYTAQIIHALPRAASTLLSELPCARTRYGYRDGHAVHAIALYCLPLFPTKTSACYGNHACRWVIFLFSFPPGTYQLCTGGSLGAAIYPIMLNHLFPTVGFAWAVRAQSFLYLGLLVISNLIMKTRLPPGGKKSVDMKGILTDVPYMICTAGYVWHSRTLSSSDRDFVAAHSSSSGDCLCRVSFLVIISFLSFLNALIYVYI